MHDGLSEAGLRAFRVAATLAAVAPSVRLRICDGDRLLTEVHRPPLPDDVEHRVVPPCVFRMAVGHACKVAADGKSVAFVGMPVGCDPAIHIALPAGDLTLPGGIWRIRHHDQWTHVFATALPLAEAMAATCDDGEDGDPMPVDGPGEGIRVGFHHDALTAITLVHVTGAADDLATAERDLDVLEVTLARCATAELIAGLPST